MENNYYYEKFKAVPEEAKKAISGGRLKGMTDINPMWRIKMLTQEFGPCGFGWYPEVVTREISEGSEGQKVAFIGLNLYVKVDNEWSKPIYGEGGASFITNERTSIFTSDEAFKMAYTDAISICCKMLGMAADIYFHKDRSKYSDDGGQPQQTKQTQSPTQETPKEWLNKWTDREHTNVSELYTKIITNAKAKGLGVTELRSFYKISKSIQLELENDLK